jgi:glycosyltransferase involved in cell wall biosynthesis
MPVTPKVSVCIPTFNYAHYLPLAIESVLNQNFTDFELIIQDDCSHDNTAEVVGRYLSDERLIFEVNERNLGLAGNWNRCLAKARGEYIKFVFADDLLASPDCLGKMVSVLDSDPSVSLVASSRNIIDSESRVVRVLSEFKESLTADGRKVIFRCLFKHINYIGEPTVVMFRKADSGRGFIDKYKHAVDWEMWFHLLERGRLTFIDEPLASFRIHPQQKTTENLRDFVDLHEFFPLLEEYLSRPYMTACTGIRYYMKMDALYLFWRMKKRGLMTRKEAVNRIRSQSSVVEFFLAYPLYKLIKPFLKLFSKATGWPTVK